MPMLKTSKQSKERLYKQDKPIGHIVTQNPFIKEDKDNIPSIQISIALNNNRNSAI